MLNDFASLYNEAHWALRQGGQAPHGYADLAREAEALGADICVSGHQAQKYGRDNASTFAAVVALVVAQARLGDPRVLEEMARASGYLLVQREHAAHTDGRGMLTTMAGMGTTKAELLSVLVAALEDGKIDAGERESLRPLLLRLEAGIALLRQQVEGAARP